MNGIACVCVRPKTAEGGDELHVIYTFEPYRLVDWGGDVTAKLSIGAKIWVQVGAEGRLQCSEHQE